MNGEIVYSTLYGVHCLDWMDTSMAGVLSFSKHCIIDGAVEITKTVTVRNDFSWNMYYRTLVSCDHCSLIKEIGYPLQSGAFYLLVS